MKVKLKFELSIKAWFLASVSFLLLSSNSLAIEGGTLAEEERWDYSVLLSMNSKSCSGTLLKSGYILTAAHCVTNDSGEVDIESVSVENPREFIGNAQLVFVDPEYDPSKVLNDVALLRLDNPEKATKYPQITNIMTSKRFVEMLGGDFPFRKSMIIGYGKDENDRSGRRKIFFGNEFGISPNGEMLEAEANTGTSRPGDSGSGVYLISDGKQTLSAVVSKGTQQYKSLHKNPEKQKASATIKISADSFVVPSLCRLDSIISQKIGFDQSYCSDVKKYLNILYEADEDSVLYLLWARALIENSPLKESAHHRFISEYFLIKSFSAGATYSNYLYFKTEEFLNMLDLFADGSENYYLMKNEIQNLGERFVELGYFQPLNSSSENWSSLKVIEKLKNTKITKSMIQGFYNELNALRKSSSCQYKICAAEFQISDGEFFKSHEKGDWNINLGFTSDEIQRKGVHYHDFKSLVCDMSDEKQFIKNVKLTFKQFGVDEKMISEIYDESDSSIVISYVGDNVEFNVRLDDGFKTAIKVGKMNIAENVVNKLIKSFKSQQLFPEYNTELKTLNLNISEENNNTLNFKNLMFVMSEYNEEFEIILWVEPKLENLESYNNSLSKLFECN